MTTQKQTKLNEYLTSFFLLGFVLSLRQKSMAALSIKSRLMQLGKALRKASRSTLLDEGPVPVKESSGSSSGGNSGGRTSSASSSAGATLSSSSSSTVSTTSSLGVSSA